MCAAANTQGGRESISLRHLWRFLGFSLPYRPSLAGGVAFGLLRLALGLFMPWYVKYIIDRVGQPFLDRKIPAAVAWERWGWITALLGGLMVVHWGATLGRFYFPHRAAASAIRDIRYRLFRHLQRLSLGFHNQRPTGAIVARVIADVQAAQQAFDMILIQLAQEVLLAIIITVALFVTDWQWALVSLTTAPLFVLVARLIRRPMRRATRKQRETVERMSGRVQERFSMIREVQSFTAEPREERQVYDQAETLRRHTVRQQLLAGVVNATGEVNRLLAMAVVLGFGVYRITTGGLAEVGTLTLFLMYTGRVLGPINFFARLYTRLQRAAAAADRVFDFFDTDPD
ncbi:MAG: ABC transporter transmembrane domain-containing protein, partial [Planctomycetota bacterium]